MKELAMKEMIDFYGGDRWLKNFKPLDFFNYIKNKYPGLFTMKYQAIDKDSGWLIFIEKEDAISELYRAYYYKKGNRPLLYNVFLKHLPTNIESGTFPYVTYETSDLLIDPVQIKEYFQRINSLGGVIKWIFYGQNDCI